MFKRVRLRLTLLLTAMCSTIMIIMTLCYLYIAEQSLLENSYVSFQGDCKTIFTNLESRSVISYEWISKLEADGKYLINLYDNGFPLSYNSVSKSTQNQQLLAEAFSFSKDQFATFSYENNSPFSARHITSAFTSLDGRKFYLSYGQFPVKNGFLEAVLLSPLETLQKQISVQRFNFLLIDLLAILAIYGISYIFTGFLLKPIETNAKKQVHFIASASHELKTPLTVIHSALSAIKKANGPKDAFYKIIEEETTRMSRLVEDMLLLANSDSHTWSIHKLPAELDTLLLNCFESFSLLTQKEGKHLSISLPDEVLPTCLCDAQRIEQVICILLHNALCYTKEGGTIRLALSYQNSFFELSVIDNGSGIDDLEKPYIFDRFYRTDQSLSQKGHFGLGLCIAKEIIEYHQGKLLLFDTPGGGTTFTIKIPC